MPTIKNLKPKPASERPIGIWIITFFYFLLESGSILYFALIWSGKAKLPFLLRSFYKDLPRYEFVLPIVIGVLMLYGVVLLFMLRRQAIYIFGGCFLFFFGITAYHIFSNNYSTWFGYWGPLWLGVSTLIKAAAFAYALYLDRIQILE